MSIPKMIQGLAEDITEILLGMVDGSKDPSPSTKDNDEYRDYAKETYDYWYNLSYEDRRFYFDNNLELQDWGENYFYDNAHQCAKSIAEIAYKENRPFINRWDRY